MAKVMLVEDDNNLREIYEARLAAEGYTIASAKDGEEALVVAKAEKPDLIISDVMMPKISGFEMLDILRNTEGLKETKVIMLTALGQSDDRTRADALGADRYLVKSQVTLEDIVKSAHELLEPEAASTPSTAEAAAETASPTTPAPVAEAAVPAVPDMPVPEIPVATPPVDAETTATSAPTPAAPVSPEASVPPSAAPQTTAAAAPEPAAAPVAAPESPVTPSASSPTDTSAVTPPTPPSAPTLDLPTPPVLTGAPSPASPTDVPDITTPSAEQAAISPSLVNDTATPTAGASSSAVAPAPVDTSSTAAATTDLPDLSAFTAPSDAGNSSPTTDASTPAAPQTAPSTPTSSASAAPTSEQTPPSTPTTPAPEAAAPALNEQGIEASADAKVESSSTSEEQTVMEAQIEDFIKEHSAATPSPTEAAATPSTPATQNAEVLSAPAEEAAPQSASTSTSDAAKDKVMDDAVNELIASTEPKLSSEVTAEEVAAVTPSPAAPDSTAPQVAANEPKPTLVAPTEKPAEPKEYLGNDSVTVAHKKVIKPLGSSDKPSLEELLAQEEAKNIIAGQAASVVSTPPPVPADQTPAPTIDVPAVPEAQDESTGITPSQPGNTFTPGAAPAEGEATTPETKKNDDFDPNSISL
jgi:CheY-like chemotaxis protein